MRASSSPIVSQSIPPPPSSSWPASPISLPSYLAAAGSFSPIGNRRGTVRHEVTMAHQTGDHSKHGHVWADDLTRNQELVLGTLAHAEAPLSAYDILDRLRSEGLRAPLQVYRALDKLTER